MSSYSEKVKKRREVTVPKEPDDDYSCLPDYASRMYFRAKAGLYGMTEKTYSDMRVEVSPYVFKRLLHHRPTKIVLLITPVSGIACGEIARDIRKSEGLSFWVYSVPYGGRMKFYIHSAEENHSPRVNFPGLSVSGFGKTSKPLRRQWIEKGPVIHMI